MRECEREFRECKHSARHDINDDDDDILIFSSFELNKKS